MTTALETRSSRLRRRRWLARRRTAVVVFDGDDTLWETEHLYDDARVSAAKVVAAAGVEPGRWDVLEREIDVANVARLGLSAARFPTSCVEAYWQACGELGVQGHESVAAEVRRAAESVFQRKAPLVPGAEAMLQQLSERVPLVLFTQGDRSVQEKRIADSGLGGFFDLVVIVDRKTPAEIKALLERVRADVPRSWFVGNSIPSDVNPALSAGMCAIWIDAHVWAHERREELIDRGGRCLTAHELLDVPGLILGG